MIYTMYMVYILQSGLYDIFNVHCIYHGQPRWALTCVKVGPEHISGENYDNGGMYWTTHLTIVCSAINYNPLLIANFWLVDGVY
jgi:hypothetical protein